jgi:23S rRNA pseudouridine1911/1915/1917 synthase
VLIAKNKRAGSFAQKAVQARRVRRKYLALLEGECNEPLVADGWLGNDPDSSVFVKQRVTKRSGKSKRARTVIDPLLSAHGFTLAVVQPETGRKHQIRVHAQSLGFPLVGDKLYGRDETLYLEFVERGWTSRLAESLPLARQALHAATFTLQSEGRRLFFSSPLPMDLRNFGIERMNLDEAVLEKVYEKVLSEV